MDDKKYFVMNEEDVKSILKELNHQFISRDNMTCFILLQRMTQFLMELENARTSKDN
jgi:hypothetical protein